MDEPISLEDAKRHWEDVLEQIPNLGMRVSLVDRPVRSRRQQKQMDKEHDELTARRALLNMGVEAKRYVRNRIRSRLQAALRFEEYFLQVWPDRVYQLTGEEIPDSLPPDLPSDSALWFAFGALQDGKTRKSRLQGELKDIDDP